MKLYFESRESSSKRLLYNSNNSCRTRKPYPHVSVIIPTLNEEQAIRLVLTDIPYGVVDEVIVVDSSTDNTPKIVTYFFSLEARVIREPRKGYGRALETGIENSKADIVVFIDGDYTYDPKEIPKLIQPILNDKYDIILGSRLRNIFPGSMSCLNKFGNLMLSLVFDVLFLRRVGDTQSGFRAIRRRFLEKLTYEDYGMPYATEQLIKIVKKGARLGEVPIIYRPRIGETKLCAWTDGFKILKTMLKERFRGC